jgi:Short C-terminal domain
MPNIGPVEVLILLFLIGALVAVVVGIVALVGRGTTTGSPTSYPATQPRNAPPTDAAQSPDRLEQLRQLTALRDAGTLSPQEFEAEKARILSGP